MQSWLLPKVFMRKLRMERKEKVFVIAVKLPKKKKVKDNWYLEAATESYIFVVKICKIYL